MRATLIAFGKLKAPGLLEACTYYHRNLGPWLNLDIVELKPVKTKDKSVAARALAQEEEMNMLLQKIQERSPKTKPKLYLLDEIGKNLSTAQWVTNIQDWAQNQSVQPIFCIGSSFGFSSSLKKSSTCFSLGLQTLSHEIARLVLIEQLYRAMSVIKNHPYHNAD